MSEVLVEVALEATRNDNFLAFVDKMSNGDYISNFSEANKMKKELLESGEYKDVKVLYRFVTTWSNYYE